ncbi:MAG: HD domain-containing protein [Bacteriovoracaceae bacterium]|nr:HD domain-containing protein [Bacteriovoracaceae bacterium]
MSPKIKKGTQVFQMMNRLHKLEHDQSKLLQTVEDKLFRFQTLLEVGQMVNTAVEFRNTSKKVLSKIKDILGCEEFVLYSIDAKTGKLKRELGGQSDAQAETDVSVQSFEGECAHYKATIQIENVQNDLRHKKDDQFGKISLKNMLLAPLMLQGEVLGVVKAINSENEEGFNSEDIYFIEQLASQLTPALQNARLFENLNTQFVQVVEALGDSIVKKDRYTGGHTKRVEVFSEMIAREMKLSFKEMTDVRLAAVLHDIGKIGIEDKILKKKSPLTTEEFEIMKKHPQMGYEILSHIDGLSNVLDGMRFHHERPDGKGYPYGLKGEDIPLIASIVSVADTFDAMISTRPYRKGLPPMTAYHEIMQYAGTQFDQRVVEAFVRGFKKTRMYKAQEDQYHVQEELKKAS